MPKSSANGNSSAENINEASVLDSLRVALKVLVPTLFVGVIKRRPTPMRISEKLQVDRTAINLMRQLRAKYGSAPLQIRVPGRSVILLLSGKDVGTLLAQTPTPFTPATTEKKAALRHFQPHGVLISDRNNRTFRRKFNEAVLEPDRPLHELAAPFTRVIHEETAELLSVVSKSTVVDWDVFNEHWWRIVRQIALGRQARDQDEVTNLLERLRFDGNWAYLHPQRKKVREQFESTLNDHLARAEPSSLAQVIARVSATTFGETDLLAQSDQMAHWLFAFDAAGIVAFRALALLASQPSEAEKVRQEVQSLNLEEPHQLPYTRACVLESVRLWPTTPMVLRENVLDTGWGRAKTTFLTFTPFFHRDKKSLPYADLFNPEIWLDGRAQENPALIPFSDGPAVCPGRNLVLFAMSTVLAELMQKNEYQVISTKKLNTDELPKTFDNFGLKLRVTPRSLA